MMTRPQSRASDKNLKTSTCKDDTSNEMLTSSSDSMDSISKHSTSSSSSKNEQENIKEVEISNCIIEHEDAGITVNNGRPDEDLDLLYDPTLDCYYDPKTNRYYELK
ncbi:hypothetical protein KC19_7G127100 [Ceratodon purpureus]|uniref:OCRE domain-containing protein n=1 Tax=Ceratodon purpureus TaxID=3225 RepID=A0A8T0H9G1_CERPU|nr:hypothetical protein KC19_7G127100 [Ceratodon purpureus]